MGGYDGTGWMIVTALLCSGTKIIRCETTSTRHPPSSLDALKEVWSRADTAKTNTIEQSRDFLMIQIHRNTNFIITKSESSVVVIL